MTDKNDQSESELKPVARWSLWWSLRVFGQTLPFPSRSTSASFKSPRLFNHDRSQIKQLCKGYSREIKRGCGCTRSCVWALASCQQSTYELSLAKEKPLQWMVRSELSHQQQTPAFTHVFTIFSDSFYCSLKQVANTCSWYICRLCGGE